MNGKVIDVRPRGVRRNSYILRFGQTSIDVAADHLTWTPVVGASVDVLFGADTVLLYGDDVLRNFPSPVAGTRSGVGEHTRQPQ
jgi:hypothetical protein